MRMSRAWGRWMAACGLMLLTLVTNPAMAGERPRDAGIVDALNSSDAAQREAALDRLIESPDADPAVLARVAELLKQPLTADAAVEVALLNNKELQASYADLGIVEADLVRAGRLANPSSPAGALAPSQPRCPICEQSAMRCWQTNPTTCTNQRPCKCADP